MQAIIGCGTSLPTAEQQLQLTLLPMPPPRQPPSTPSMAPPPPPRRTSMPDPAQLQLMVVEPTPMHVDPQPPMALMPPPPRRSGKQKQTLLKGPYEALGRVPPDDLKKDGLHIFKRGHQTHLQRAQDEKAAKKSKQAKEDGVCFVGKISARASEEFEEARKVYGEVNNVEITRKEYAEIQTSMFANLIMEFGKLKETNTQLRHENAELRGHRQAPQLPAPPPTRAHGAHGSATPPSSLCPSPDPPRLPLRPCPGAGRRFALRLHPASSASSSAATAAGSASSSAAAAAAAGSASSSAASAPPAAPLRAAAPSAVSAR
eukprot:tig00021439_g21484.t1